MNSFDFLYASPSEPMEILEPLFAQEQSCTVVPMPSGRNLLVTIKDEEVSVSDEEYWDDYVFIARLWKGAFGSKNAVSFHIDTHGKSRKFSRRHPDLYAARLMSRSIDFFENGTHLGKPLDRIWAQWAPKGHLSDNYVQFTANLAKGMSTEVAAINTWTGIQAAKLGFTAVRGVFMLEGLLHTYFDRA